MNEDELSWTTNQHVGDTSYYFSENNRIDTLLVTHLEIHNSKSPFNGNINVSRDYIPTTNLEFSLRHEGEEIEGWVFTQKRVASLFFSVQLDKLYLFDQYQMPDSYYVEGAKYDDCMLFVYDSTRVEQNNRERQKYKGKIESFIWSKSQGLLRYNLFDGTQYSKKEQFLAFPD